ncbi:hypothetical protein SPLC1_S204440 [Arthrospira platensis C1]|nr:hypothetical protein SPLC1_S204440 [Arthrospira platensis C1]
MEIRVVMAIWFCETGNGRDLLVDYTLRQYNSISRVLQEFAAEFKLGPNQHIMLVVDQAGWHISKNLKVPEGLHLMFLPSHSPELQPAERLWPLVDEPIANRSFENLDQLEELLCARCRSLWKQR